MATCSAVACLGANGGIAAAAFVMATFAFAHVDWQHEVSTPVQSPMDAPSPSPKSKETLRFVHTAEVFKREFSIHNQIGSNCKQSPRGCHEEDAIVAYDGQDGVVRYEPFNGSLSGQTIALHPAPEESIVQAAFYLRRTPSIRPFNGGVCEQPQLHNTSQSGDVWRSIWVLNNAMENDCSWFDTSGAADPDWQCSEIDIFEGQGSGWQFTACENSEYQPGGNKISFHRYESCAEDVASNTCTVGLTTATQNTSLEVATTMNGQSFTPFLDTMANLGDLPVDTTSPRPIIAAFKMLDFYNHSKGAQVTIITSATPDDFAKFSNGTFHPSQKKANTFTATLQQRPWAIYSHDMVPMLNLSLIISTTVYQEDHLESGERGLGWDFLNISYITVPRP